MPETIQKQAPDANIFARRSKPVMAFLQARMGSTRLPGKVLMHIHGQSILERAIRRLRAAPIVDRVVVLTTCLSQDDAVVEETQKLGAELFRGPVDDVLTRFYAATAKFRPGIIIRATADNPLIEIGSIERIVDALDWGGFDFCMEEGLSYGAATEAVTAEALIRVHKNARDQRHREHVTLYIKEHPEEYRISYLTPPESLQFPKIRLTVDTPEDFAFMEELIGKIPERRNPIPLSEFLPHAKNIYD
jgi:spore coat polysaccharide biosynthesis protein SpsF